MNYSRTASTETDVVVLGSGGAGLGAAAAAAEKGAKVIVLEKRGVIGGNWVWARSSFAIESKPQKRMRIDATRDVLFKMHMDFTHWQVNPRLVRAVIDKSGDTIQWLEDKGVTIVDVPRFFPNQLIPTLHEADKKGAGGRLILKALLKSCEDMGVRLLLRTAAKKILTGERGEVTGVLASTKGEEFNISARSVVVGTGGYGGNKKLLKKYIPYYTEDISMFGLPLMGDGLLMATEIGAATEGLGMLLLGGPSLGANARKFPCLNSIQGEPARLWVNKKGERFMDENIVVPHTAGNAIVRQPDKVCYSLFDDKTVQEVVRAEAAGDFSRYRGQEAKKTGLKRELELAAEKDMVKVSDSWGEIAKWIGAAPKVLRSTIDEYNSFCDKGHDEIFVKEQRHLQALRTPPYYAVRCYARFSTTIGGIKINHRMEVLNDNDEPIRGLYAGGDTTGGWEHDTYDDMLSGFASSFALNSGRIAGENAARYVLRK